MYIWMYPGCSDMFYSTASGQSLSLTAVCVSVWLHAHTCTYVFTRSESNCYYWYWFVFIHLNVYSHKSWLMRKLFPVFKNWQKIVYNKQELKASTAPYIVPKTSAQSVSCKWDSLFFCACICKKIIFIYIYMYSIPK